MSTHTSVRRFTPLGFHDTGFATAQEKASFANWMIHFIDKGFPLDGFPNTKYQRLMNMFCHVAEYNRFGFHHVWFADNEKQQQWFDNVARFAHRHGDPTNTWCDVEMVVLNHLVATGRVTHDDIW